MPLLAAGDALRIMDTDDLAAVRAGPFLSFAFDELPYAGLFYGFEIVDHAHAVLCSVALVQVVQAVAREAAAIKAVSGFAFRYVFAVLDFADDAGFRFVGIVTPAAGTWIPVSYISPAQATAHPARCDQGRVKRISLCLSSWCHVCIFHYLTAERWGKPHPTNFSPCHEIRFQHVGWALAHAVNLFERIVLHRICPVPIHYEGSDIVVAAGFVGGIDQLAACGVGIRLGFQYGGDFFVAYHIRQAVGAEQDSVVLSKLERADERPGLFFHADVMRQLAAGGVVGRFFRFDVPILD